MTNPSGDNAYLADQATKGAKTRLQLVKAGIQCVVLKGFEGTSLTEIGKQAGLNRALLVHYFATKERFFSEMARYVSINGRAFTESFMSSQTSIIDPVERYLKATIAWGENSPDLLAFLILGIQRATYDRAYGKWISESFSVARSRLVNLLDSYADPETESRLSKERKTDLAEQIHAALLGCLISASIREPSALSRYEQHCISLFRSKNLKLKQE